jgi:regulator of protease activity HflC (stomatin/prohibitin superfamily)
MDDVRVTAGEFIIKSTHSGVWYENGVLKDVRGAGRYTIPRRGRILFRNRPHVECILVDIRERDLTIKGQEILTADKVAIRVSIVVQFRVVDPRAAVQEVESYEDRLYTDVQLAARRSLASTTLEEILTNRNRLSEDILQDVKESAAAYGVSIHRADVKDLIFPGNLQEIMNRVLAAERMSEAQLVEARTKAEVQQIESQAKAEAERREAEVRAEAARRLADSEADALRIKTQSEVAALKERELVAQAYTAHPSLLRLEELQTLAQLAKSANARIYVGFDRPATKSDTEP